MKRPPDCIKVDIPREHAELMIPALRLAARVAEERLATGEVYMGREQPGMLRWLATYIEHVFRDTYG